MASNTYSQGAQVEHMKFGLGTVLSSSEERIVIKFDDHGEKKFVTTHGDGQFEKERPGSHLSKRRAPARRRLWCPQRRSSRISRTLSFERKPETVI